MSITEEYPELEAVIERCVIGGVDRAEAEHLISSLVNYSITESSHYSIKDNFGGACPKSNIAQKQSFRTFINKRARNMGYYKALAYNPAPVLFRGLE